MFSKWDVVKHLKKHGSTHICGLRLLAQHMRDLVNVITTRFLVTQPKGLVNTIVEQM